jgi:hypothetical protein
MSASADGRYLLISHTPNPLVTGRENRWVLFVTDAGLADSTQSFEWSFTENGGTPVTQKTDFGETAYAPQAAGVLVTAVRLLGAADAEQSTLNFSQDIVAPNAELEGLITAGQNDDGPTVSNPDVVRELINEHNAYYQAVALSTPEAGDDFQRFVFSAVYDGANRRTPAERSKQLAALSESLNGDGSNFGSLAAQEVGVCGVRLHLLAMIQPQGAAAKLIDWTELPEPTAARSLADQQLRQRLQSLDESARIDLFNLARFPKSNIVHSGRILEALRDRYFPGTAFKDVLTGMSGTRAQRIVQHFREGPLTH